MSERTYIVDLERQIAEDHSGAARDALCAELAEDRAALKRRLDAGLSPAEFDAANKLLAAFDAASRAVRTLWSTVHPGRR